MNIHTPETHFSRTEWHIKTRTEAARLVMVLCQEINPQARGNANDPLNGQGDTYRDAYRKLRQLTVDIALYDTQGVQHGKTYTHIG